MVYVGLGTLLPRVFGASEPPQFWVAHASLAKRGAFRSSLRVPGALVLRAAKPPTRTSQSVLFFYAQLFHAPAALHDGVPERQSFCGSAIPLLESPTAMLTLRMLPASKFAANLGGLEGVIAPNAPSFPWIADENKVA